MAIGNDFLSQEIEYYPLSPRVRVCIPQTAPLLLPSSIEDEVEAIWNEQQNKKMLFNQPILSLLSFTPEKIMGRFVEYRYLVACQENPTLRKYIDISPLAVSGVCIASGYVLIGTRDMQLASFGGYMECVPSGGIETRAYSHGEIDFFMQLLWELEEEAHIGAKRVKELHPLGLYYSKDSGVYDIGMLVVLDLQEQELSSDEGSLEYPLLEWISFDQWNETIKDLSKKIVPLSKTLFLHSRCI
jgi:hypothetical protein